MLLLVAALAVCAPGPRDHCVHDGDTVWWEGEKIRIVKEVKRNRETVHYYDADDTLTRTHTNRYWLQRRGNYNTWTYPGMKIVEGTDAGTQVRFPQPEWYIYQVNGDQLVEFQGLGKDDGKPQYMVWSRVAE